MPVPGAVVYTGTKYRLRPWGVRSREVGNIWPSPVVASRQRKANVVASFAPLLRLWLWHRIVCPHRVCAKAVAGSRAKGCRHGQLGTTVGDFNSDGLLDVIFLSDG